MRRFLRSLRFSLCFVILSVLPALSFPACAPARGDPFAYADGAFSVPVRGTYTPAEDGIPRAFSATVTVGAVTVGAPADGDPLLRDLTVTFTAPESLAGMTVTASAGSAAGSAAVLTYPSVYGDIQIAAAGEELDGFLRFAEALLPIGDVAEASPTGADGSYTVTRRAEGREATFTFTEGRDLPIRVTVVTPEEVLTLTVSP